jgi:hypothetical protein
MKRSILQNPMFRTAPGSAGNTRLRQTLFEPFYVVAACLMWVAVLPSASLFCAGVEVYDQVTSPHWA